jgi:hypothetical protein
MEDFKFVGTAGIEAVNRTVGSYPWEFREMSQIPYYPVVNYPNGYLVTAGSACLSLATTSCGITYNSAIDIIRLDLNPRVIDTDHYMAMPWKDNIFAVFMTPQIDYHHLSVSDQLVSNLSLPWQKTIKQILLNPHQI